MSDPQAAEAAAAASTGQEQDTRISTSMQEEIDRAKEDLRFEESRWKASGVEPELFRWLSTVSETVSSSLSSSLQPHIQSIHSAFLTLLIPSGVNYPYPKPGRPFRHLMARSIITLHQKVESRTLFDFTQSLIRFLGENGGSTGKNGWDLSWRVAGWYMVGEVMQVLGGDVSHNPTVSKEAYATG